MTNVYPRSTTEMIYMPMTNDGVIVTTGITYSIVKEVPGTITVEGTHTAADIMNGKTGRIISAMSPGVYKVWGAVTGLAQEAPHVYLGSFRISE
jgi:hypothetical protein